MRADYILQVAPVPCQHIADFYAQRQTAHPCIAFNLLRRGYAQWALGTVRWPENNLFSPCESTCLETAYE